MTHAIVYVASNTVVKDAQGHGHIYSSKEMAEKIRDMYFAGRTDVRVQPW